MESEFSEFTVYSIGTCFIDRGEVTKDPKRSPLHDELYPHATSCSVVHGGPLYIVVPPFITS